MGFEHRQHARQQRRVRFRHLRAVRRQPPGEAFAQHVQREAVGVDHDEVIQDGAAAGVAKGAYVLYDPPAGKPDVILMGTGSEVGLCLEACDQLSREGVKARVVSMPSWELFNAQDAVYRDSVLTPQVTARVAVEAGVRQGWDRYLGSRGRFVGMSSFGASGPFEKLYQYFGITTEAVVAAAKNLVGK